MIARESVCLRRLSGGQRAEEVKFGRFLANEDVTVERLLAGWSEQTAVAAAGRHVLAIQDTSEINFRTTVENRRGLGEIGKGGGYGVLLHAMVAVDADNGHCLGLVGGRVWTRAGGRVSVPHAKRPLEEKESERWVSTGEQAKRVLSCAATVTVIADRESDLYPEWASLPGANFHLITRVMHDRSLTDDKSLYAAGEGFAVADTKSVNLPARGPQRPARLADLMLRFGPVMLRRPRDPHQRHLPETVPLRLVEVIERSPPDGADPVHWRLLTTHEVADVATAWRIVDWYKQRWIIEQLFRLMKLQGLQVEDSQLDSADRLIKLVAIAAKAAAVILQLTQARDGRSTEPATVAFQPDELPVLEALNAKVEGKTALQTNPHTKHTLAWASWIIARLGGWNGYPSSKPPGPITFRHGLEYFRVASVGWGLKNVCIP